MGLDQGTTSTKAVILDHSGAVVSSAAAELHQFFPQPGWVEHDPEEILALTLRVFSEALSKSDIAPSQIAALGITNQRETLTFWNRHTGKPVGRAIVWQDRRSLEICEDLKASDGAGILDRTGAAIVPNAAGTKIKWLMENDPRVRQGVERGELICGTIDSWLLWNIGRAHRHATDRSNASVTLLLNARTREYDEDMLHLLGIPRTILPELVDTSEVVDTTDPSLTGHPIPIAALAGDQTAAALGQACISPGMVKNTYGTGSFMVMNTGRSYIPPTTGIMAPILWTISQRTEYGLEGYADVSGAGIQWLRDMMGALDEAGNAEEIAKTVPDSGGVYFVPAFSGLGSPHFDSYARGTIFGLTRGSSKAHLVRAALEAIAYQVRDALIELEQCSGITTDVIRVDGGASKNNFLMQFQSDILGIPIERPLVSETTCAGAALLAGVAVGYWHGPDEACSTWKLDRRFEPRIGDADRSSMVARWHEAIERSQGWLRDR